MKVSFDYDGTLSLSYVEEFAKELVDKGYEVWVVTSRADDEPTNLNNDLWESCKRIGIPKTQVKFTKFVDKIEFLKGNNYLFHLDDDLYELITIMESKDSCKPLNVGHSDWKENCIEVLNKKC